MSIRKKILLYFSVVVPVIMGIAFIFIYILFSENREEGFQMRQKDKISTTLKLLTQIKQTDDELIDALDHLTINDLFDEKLLIFNSAKELIYTSIDDTPVPISKEMLSELNAKNDWIETKDGLYDVVGIYIESNESAYYGISKAYDTFGYSKLRYLKYILTLTFVSISIIILLVSFYLSKKITQPLLAITNRINNYDFEGDYHPIIVEQSKNEIAILATQFNKLMKKMNEVFSFQKHAIHHISHELKTPIAVLVSNFERIENETSIEKIQDLIKIQKEDTKSLSDIINSLLEIAKAETGNSLTQDKIRIDELIFDVSDELKNVYPNFQFAIEYSQTNDEASLVVSGNILLLKAALMNLMLNCIHYSNDKKGRIFISGETDNLILSFENNGAIISENENRFLFQHFFRGKNSKGKRGFGLGLVFIHKIISLHGGKVSYHSVNNCSNVFTVILPVS